MVVSLDFNNDFKKLYCIITEMDRPKKFHIGSHMIINTARFEFDDLNKCNGYIEFDGKKWSIVALKSTSHLYRNNLNDAATQNNLRNLSESEDA